MPGTPGVAMNHGFLPFSVISVAKCIRLPAKQTEKNKIWSPRLHIENSVPPVFLDVFIYNRASSRFDLYPVHNGNAREHI